MSGRDDGWCAHCGQPIRRIHFPQVTGDPYMWIHHEGSQGRCERTLSSPYATPKEQP